MKKGFIDERVAIVEEVARKDIERFIEYSKIVKQYEKELQKVKDNIYIKMKANSLVELNKVKFEKEHFYESIEIGELLNVFNNEEIVKTFVVQIDIKQTQKNLIEKYGFTDTIIYPLITLLKTRLSSYQETLVVKENE